LAMIFKMDTLKIPEIARTACLIRLEVRRSTMIMRRLMLMLLLASSLVVSSLGTSASATSPRGHLHRLNNIEEHPDQDSHLRRLSSDSNDSAESDENNDDTNIFTQAKSRVEQDFSDMWSSSPSEWSQEFWEVFVVLLSLVIVGTLCVCIACIVPLWFPEQYTAPSKELDDKDDNNVMSNETSEPGPHQDKKWVAPIWFPGQSTAPSKELEDNNVMTSEPGPHQDKKWVAPVWFPGQSTALSKELEDKNVMTGEPGAPDESNQPILDQPISMSNATDGSAIGSAGPPRSKDRPREKRNLLSEVVSVWTEFLVELGWFTERSHQKHNQPYRKYKERHSSRRETSSHNTYKAPASPRKSKIEQTKQIEYDTVDVSSHEEEEPPHKVEKYQGIIV
jgi:hypothetical protein